MVNDAFASTLLSQQLANCALIRNNQARLACYDALASNTKTSKGQNPAEHFIQPPEAFLKSHLVSEPWKAEYTLSVKSFVDLISQAVMEDKKLVTVQGWSRDKHEYVLHITMQGPVKLHFLPRDSGKGDKSMSLLKDVKMNGYSLGADQFILTIAAMVPDKK